MTDSNETEAFEVAGRGELQLGVLIEQMRREGFELTIGRPRVLTRSNPETGEREEPMEEVLVDVDEPYSGVVVEKTVAAARASCATCGRPAAARCG